jgi:hypothetical protein
MPHVESLTQADVVKLNSFNPPLFQLAVVASYRSGERIRLTQIPQYSPNAPHFSGRQVESRHYI